MRNGSLGFVKIKNKKIQSILSRYEGMDLNIVKGVYYGKVTKINKTTLLVSGIPVRIPLSEVSFISKDLFLQTLFPHRNENWRIKCHQS